MKFFNHYKTIVIADIALGASPEHFKKLIFFLKNTSCDKLIFCGDIIKGWQSKKIGKLYKLHNKFLKTLLKISERDNTEIIFVAGNEWDWKENQSSFRFYNFLFVQKYIFNSSGNYFYVMPGEISNLPENKNFSLLPVYKFKYNLLVWLNKKYNDFRIERGNTYRSLLKQFSNSIQKQASIYQCFDEYKLNLIDISIKKECDGIICAHPDYSGIFHFGDITVISTGNWTETLCAMAESNYGKWEIIDYEKIVSNKMEAMEHAGIIEELFEEEKNLINLHSEKLTKG
jgi:UDP-2,3-diacylglucosamine pyrophosphatase LpxH